MPARAIAPLAPKDIRRRFDPRKVPFETSQELPACQEPVVGQKRAKHALQFGIAIQDMDHHIFVDGPQRTGKTHLIRSFLESYAKEQAAPGDWCYVHNFSEPTQPLALGFAKGGGRVFSREMEVLLEGLKNKIPAAFGSEDYAKQKEKLAADFKKFRSQVFQDLDKLARGNGYVLRFDPTGIMVAPADEDGQPLPEERIREMSDEERADLRDKSDRTQSKVTESLRSITAREKELEDQVKNLNREVALSAAAPVVDFLTNKYADQPAVLAFLKQVREEVADNFGRFQKAEAPHSPLPTPQQEDIFREFQVNVFVDNSQTVGAPVVVEANPTFPNLFGRIERQAQFGTLVTDFTLLSPGTLHKANGGFLVIPVLDLLRYWIPWEGLKRALKEREAVMEDAVEQMGFMVTRSLRPSPIPLDLKVILVGHTHIYHLLYAHDPQFPKLFKIRAQMAEHMNWARDEISQFIEHLCTRCSVVGHLPLHRGAVARLVELAAELAGDQERLTLQLADVEDVVRESCFLATKSGNGSVLKEDVEEAIAARRYRASMTEERLREGITRGFINVETRGEQVGQVNGLAVLNLGDHTFGIPSRISASLGLGKAGVVGIDREAKLSGSFHDKGVLILEGFLHDRFAQKGGLTLTASLVFEQSYSHIDGDSATIAEALALLSRISGLPLKQSLAVTGSMSQKGQAQAIGGVNQKIEGFFRLCVEEGLTGEHGVIIPKSNVKNLMLHPDIVAACRKKKFSVYAVETIEEAFGIFTGKEAGVRNKSGNYPRTSGFYLVEKELKRLRELGDKKKKPAKKTAAAKTGGGKPTKRKGPAGRK